MAKNRYRVTDKKIKLVYKLNKTKSQRQIAELVELSQGTVCKLLNARMLSKRVKRKVPVSPFFTWERYDNSIIL